MTPSRYFLARIGKSIGYCRKTRRMTDAAAETHLLRDAEMYLGGIIWRNVENIEALSVEYWNLRKLDKKRRLLTEQLAECQTRLEETHQERTALLNEIPEHLKAKREKQHSELEAIAKKRDSVMEEARSVRRQFTGLKTELEVIINETGETDSSLERIDQIKPQLRSLKKRFEELKEEHTIITEKITDVSAELDKIDTEISRHRTECLDKAAEAIHIISDSNRAFSTLKAEITVVETQMHELHGKIGHYASYHAYKNESCKQACTPRQDLVDVLFALRESIALNNKLAKD